ncbi:hypothetical protein L9F63_004861, partial [Diploptera punctata]
TPTTLVRNNVPGFLIRYNVSTREIRWENFYNLHMIFNTNYIKSVFDFVPRSVQHVHLTAETRVYFLHILYVYTFLTSIYSKMFAFLVTLHWVKNFRTPSEVWVVSPIFSFLVMLSPGITLPGPGIYVCVHKRYYVFATLLYVLGAGPNFATFQSYTMRMPTDVKWFTLWNHGLQPTYARNLNSPVQLDVAALSYFVRSVIRSSGECFQYDCTSFLTGDVIQCPSPHHIPLNAKLVNTFALAGILSKKLDIFILISIRKIRWFLNLEPLLIVAIHISHDPVI